MKYFKLHFVLLITILTLTACGSTNASVDDTLTIGVMPDMGAVPFVIAAQNGYYDELGLTMDIQVFRSAQDRDTALQTGNLDGAMADLLTILFFNQSGFDVKMTSDTYGNYMMVSSPQINATDLTKLDSISIGMSSNTVIDFTTEMIAESLSFEDRLEKVAIPQMPVRLEMLASGELNGATLPDPLATTAILNGGEKVSDTESFDLYPAIFMMNQDAIDQHSPAILAMYQAYNKAVDYLNETDPSNFYSVLVDVLGFPDGLEDSISFPEYVHIQPADESTFQKTQEWMQARDLISDTYSYDNLSDNQFIKDLD